MEIVILSESRRISKFTVYWWRLFRIQNSYKTIQEKKLQIKFKQRK